MTIAELYKKANDRGVLKSGLTEEQFTKQISTDEGLRSFYNYATTKGGMKFHPYDEFKQRIGWNDTFGSPTQEDQPNLAEVTPTPTSTIEQPKEEKKHSFVSPVMSPHAAAYQAAENFANQQKKDQAERERINNAQLHTSDNDKQREKDLQRLNERVEADAYARNPYTQQWLPEDVKKQVQAGREEHVEGLKQVRDELQGQRAKYMDEPKTLEEAFENYATAWTQNTEEGKAALQELNDIRISKIDKLQTEFLGSKTATDIFADVEDKYRKGELTFDESNELLNSRLDAAFISEYEDRLQQVENERDSELTKRVNAADNGWLKRQQERILEQGAADALNENYETISTAIGKAVEENRSMGMAIGNAMGGSAEMAAAQSLVVPPELKAALQLYQEAETLLYDTKKGEGNFWTFGKEIARHTKNKFRDLATFGGSTIVDASVQANVLKKIAEAGAYEAPEKVLSENEMILYDAIITELAVELVRKDNRSYGAMAGQMTAEMIPFVRDIAVGKGLFGGLSAAAGKGLMRGIVRSIGTNKLGKLLVNAGRTGINFAESAVMASISPATFQKMLQNEAKIDQSTLQLTDTGWQIAKIDTQGKGISYWEAVKEQVPEYFTETGGVTQFAANIVKSSRLGKFVANSTFGQLAKALDGTYTGKFLNQTAYNGVWQEWGEELENTFYQAIRAAHNAEDGKGMEAFKNTYGEFFSPETQVPMLLSFSLPAMLGGTVGTAQAIAINKKYDKAYNQIMNRFELLGFESKEEREDLLNNVLAKVYNADVVTNAGEGRPLRDYPKAIRKTAMEIIDSKYGKEPSQRAQDSYAMLLADLSEYIYADQNLSAIQTAHAKKQRQVQGLIREMDATEQRIAQDTHTDGMMYHVEVDGMSGYLVRGKLSFKQYEGDAFGRGTGTEIVTVRMQDGSVKQVAADQIKLLEQPQAAENVATIERRRMTAKMNNLDRFKVGDVVYLTENGQPIDGNSSRVLNITNEGIEVGIVDPNGQPNTTVIPHTVAESGLSTIADLLLQDEGKPYKILVNSDNTGDPIVLQEKKPGVWTDVSLAARGKDVTYTQEKVDEMIATGLFKVSEGDAFYKGDSLGEATSPTDDVASGNGVVSEEAGEIEQPTEQPASKYPTTQEGKLDWRQMDVPTATEAAIEKFGDKNTAKEYAELQIAQAKKAMAAANKKKATSTDADEFVAQKNAIRQEQQAAQAELSKWENILLGIANYKTAEEQAAEEQAAQRAAEERARRKQTIEGVGGTNMAERLAASPRIDGNAGSITAADGTKIPGHYVLVSANALTPSHNPNANFAPSEGYPTVDGQSINDRDYQADREEQAKVQQVAQTYDGRAITNMPIVSDEGLVYSGNGRTMAGQLAAANGTDGAYIEALKENANQFGFTAEQVDEVPNARVVFMTDERLPYNTSTLALFNMTEQQTQSNTAAAAANVRKLTPEAVGHIIAAVQEFDTVDAFFNDSNAPFELVNQLIADGIISNRDKAAFVDNNRLTATGKDRLTALLFGTAFDEKTIRLLGSNAKVRNSVMRALPQILENKGLGDFSLFEHINNAIQAIYDMDTNKMSFFEFTRQIDIEGKTASDKYSAFELLLVDEMYNGGVQSFRDVLNSYNTRAKESAGGQMDLFTGETLTTEVLTTQILEQYEQRETNERGGAQSESAVAGAQEGDGEIGQEPANLIQGTYMTADEVVEIVKAGVADILEEQGLSEDVEVVSIEVIGSRSRGEAKEDSDLDILLYYKGDIKEDTMFNALNPNEITINGISVDINPIRDQESGDPKKWHKRDDAWREQDREKTERTPREEPVQKSVENNGKAQQLNDFAEKLGAKGLHIIESKEDLPKSEGAAYRALKNGAKVMGWYNPKTNQAYIYGPNADNLQEVYLTLLHEFVAHKGLRDMLGAEDYDALCTKVWDMMSEQDKLVYAVYAKMQITVGSKKMQDTIDKLTDEQKNTLLADKKVQLEAADEYMAHFAETGVSEQERTVWQKICDWVRDALRKMGISVRLKNADIARLLYESSRRVSDYMTMREVAERISKNNKVYSNLAANAKNMGLSGSVRYRITEDQDKAYADAVDRGDIETAQKMLQDAAEKLGYLPQADYQDAHGAPRASVYKEDFTNAEAMQEAADNGEDTNLWAVAQGISIQPSDYFSPQGPRWYGYSNQSGMESYAALSSAIRSINSQLNEYGEVKDMPKVKVYRTVPTNIAGEQLESEGQWVTPSLEYAVRHGENRFGGNYRIIDQEVPADQLWWDGMDPREWGFDDGTVNLYQNTPNNRKLFEVTYDDNGNLIPLSERFNKSKEDIRFRIGTQVVPMGDNTLVGLHNISANKLRKAIKQGGLANPSVAVINMSIQDHEQYGEVSLVMPSSMIDSTTGRNAGTYTGDIWSLTYPYVERKMSSKGSDKYYDALNKAFDGKNRDVKSRTALIFVNMLDNQGNPDNLAYWYMLEKGIAPTDVIINSGISDDIKQRFEPLIDKRFASDLTTDERELLLGIAAELEGKTTEELLQAAQEAKKRYEDTVLANEKASQFSRNIALSAIDEIDTYGVRLNVLSDTMRRVREAIDKDGGVDVNATISAAVDYVQENGLKGDFDAWLDNLDDRFGIEEVIFDGYTRDGDRKYVKNTIANASRLMNQQPIQNATSYGGLSATRGQLVERMSTLAQIRANKHRLAAINEYEDEQWKAMQDEWFNEIINPLSEMQKIDDNPFINTDIAEQRLLEAIMAKDPIAYLNREYKYNIAADSKFAKALKDLMGRLKALPSKYFETKFKRPVMLNEFVSAVVPQDLPQDLKDSLKEAGLDVYEYNDTEGSRREATIEATNGEGVRFRIGDDHLSVEENANLIENNLHNSKKNSTFVAEMEKLIESDTVSAQEVKQFIDRVRNGRQEKTLQMGRLRMDGTSRGNDLYWCGAVIGEAVVLHQEKSGVSSQSSLLGSNLFIEVAKQLNAFTDYNEFVEGLGAPIGQGQEAIVWVKDDDGDVVKALHYNALIEHNTQQLPAIIESISWFNHLFPDNQLSLNQVLGLHNNNLYVEVTQGYVDGEHPNFEDWGEVGAFINQMQAKGFEATIERGGEIILYKDNFEVRDLVGRNVIKDEDGVFHVIDANISQEVKEKPEIRFSVDNSSDDIRFRISNENQRIFVSNAEKAVEGIKQEKATPQQWKAMIEKQGGLKAGEDKWLGLSEWLDAQDKKTITKQEILDFISENQIQIEEVTYSAEPKDEVFEEYKKEFRDYYFEAQDNGAENPQDVAWDRMIEEHGEDFGLGFWAFGPELQVEEDSDYYKWEYENKTNERSINHTRLDYTTEGLENKREIALTVPAIESWSVSDEIHFGDAGEGRAVAWVRFGETSIPNESNPKTKEFLDAEEERKNFSRKMMAKYGLTYTEGDMSRDELQQDLEITKRISQLKDAQEKIKVLVIDEIQSKRHQEGREKGYKGAFDKAALEQAQKESKEYGDYLYEKYIKGKRKGEDFLDYATEEEKAKFRELSDKVAEIDKLRYHGIPDAPFEKNWHELAFKRILRYAAENGFDKVAWTTGAQQAERYDIGSTINVIDVNRDEIDDDIMDVYIYTTKQSRIRLDVSRTTGKVVYVADMYKEFMDKPLSELIGKDLANDIIKSEYEHHRYEGDGLRIGGEGMKGFYDKMLPSFVSKYVKKWGANVGEVTMPQLQEGYQTMHSVDITPEMRESVMEGQVMFRISSDKNDVQNVATDIWNKYQYDGELESMRDVAEYAEEHMPKNAQTQALFDAIDAYRIEAEEDRMYYGMRGDLEPFEAAIMDEVERLMNATTQSKLTESEQLTFDALQDVAADAGLDVTVGVSQEEALKAITQSDEDVEPSIRSKPAPKKTGIGYKVFYRGKDGKLYPPMVANPNGADTPIGVWLDADAAPMAGESKTGRPQVKAGGKGTQGGSGTLAYRPGWHLGEIPYALQFNRKDESGEKTLFPKDFVWAEVEYADDVNYQEEAESYGYTENGKYRHSYAGLPRVPENGSYRYRTNPNPQTDPWIITGAMKVNRVLTKEEVDEIVRKAGREPQPVELFTNMNGTILGYAQGNHIVLTKEGMTPETVVHEYTHVWAKAMQRKNRAGWENIKQIFRESPLWDVVKNDPNYQDLKTDDAICSEVLARFSGKRGAAQLDEVAREMILEEQHKGSNLGAARTRQLINRAKQAIKSFWKWVGKNLFGITKFDSQEDVADRVLYDLVYATDLEMLDAVDDLIEFAWETPEQAAAMQEWSRNNPTPLLKDYANTQEWVEALHEHNTRKTAYAQRLKEERKKEFARMMLEKAIKRAESADPIAEPLAERPKREKDETAYEYAMRLKAYTDSLAETEVSRWYQKTIKMFAWDWWIVRYVDRAKPLWRVFEFAKKSGAKITDESYAYDQVFLAKGRIQYAFEKFNRNEFANLTEAMRDIIDSKQLDSIELVWQNMDIHDTGYSKNGERVTPRELIGLYAQAKDCEEAEEKGLPDRGKDGFLKNIGISYQELIKLVEGNVDSLLLDNLWKATRACTQFALKYELDSRFISPEKYAENDREYYVPQRGWREQAESSLQFIYGSMSGKTQSPTSAFNAALVKARGRHSLADDPYNYIASIAYSAIMQSENNKIGQSMLKFCLDNLEWGAKHKVFRMRRLVLMNDIDPETGKVRKDKDGIPITTERYSEPSAEDKKHDEAIHNQIKNIKKSLGSHKKALAKELELRGDSSPLVKALQREIAKEEAQIADLQDTLRIATNISNADILQRSSAEKLQHSIFVVEDGKRYEITFEDPMVANVFNKANRVVVKRFLQELTENIGDAIMLNAQLRYERIKKAYDDGRISEDKLKKAEKAYKRTEKFAEKLGPLMSFLGNSTNLYAGALTQYNPVFAGSNVSRDFGFAKDHLRIAHPELVKDFRAAARDKELWRAVWLHAFNDKLKDKTFYTENEYGKLLEEFFESGAQTGYSYLPELREIKRNLDKELKKGKVRESAERTIDAFSLLTEYSENYTRFCAFVAAKKNGWTTTAAASLAKNLTTNFDKRGEVPLPMCYAFLRASVNALSTTWSIFRKAPKRFAYIALAHVAVGMINQLLNPNDPDDEIWASDYIRENNYVIWKLRIPVAHFFRAFHAIGVNMMMAMQGSKTTEKALYDARMAIYREVLPGPLNVTTMSEWSDENNEKEYKALNLIQGLAPSVISPITDVMINRNFMGSTINKEPYPGQENTKDIFLAKERTDDIYKRFTQEVYELAGGDMSIKNKMDDDWLADKFDWSASTVEHLKEGYALGVFEFVGSLLGILYNAVEGKEISTKDMPFVNKFYNTYSNETAYNQLYWSLYKPLKEYDKLVKEYKDGNPKKYAKETQSDTYRVYKYAKNRKLLKEPKENPTLEDVKQLYELHKQWIQARK